MPSIDLTEDELNVLQKGMCLIRDLIRIPHEEITTIHIQEKLRDTISKLESEKTYPVQDIFEDIKGKYEFRKDNGNWFCWGMNGNLIYSETEVYLTISPDFISSRYHRRERKE